MSIQEVYEKIALHFSQTRSRIWPQVKTFLNSLDDNKEILDIGCGNGKNMYQHSNLKFYGIDTCNNFLKIINEKILKDNLDNITLKYGDIRNIPYEDNTFDNFMCIACYHHLNNNNDRIKALNEMYRILKKDGIGLITMWAMEQEDDSPFHFTERDTMLEWKCRTDRKKYYRYYRIYRENDFEEEVNKTSFKIINKSYCKGNWNYILQK